MLSSFSSYSAMMMIRLVVEMDNCDDGDADYDDDDDDDGEGDDSEDADDNGDDNDDDDDYKGDDCRAGFASQLHSLQSRR